MILGDTRYVERDERMSLYVYSLEYFHVDLLAHDETIRSWILTN